MPTFISASTRHFRTACLLFTLLSLYACAAAPTSPPDADSAKKPETTTTAAETVETPKAKAESDAAEVAFVPPEPEPESKETAIQPEATEAVRIDVSCKNEPFSKHEKQSRNSIAKGLAATTAGTYGVGFRDLNEHKKWSKTHGALFKAVNSACSALSKCAKKHPKDKTKQCAQQAAHFAQWQELSAQFAEKAKQSETTQPPKICSFSPSLDDAANCFHALGDNLDKACKSSACKDASNCWRSIGFLDYAINQAASACGFARQALSECRGYLTTTQRRKDKFKRCQAMQKELNIRVVPVL